MDAHKKRHGTDTLASHGPASLVRLHAFLLRQLERLHETTMGAAVTASIAAGAALTTSAATARITLIGTGLVPGNLLDLSGLDGDPICRLDPPNDCIDQATFGGWGSGLTFTGRDKVYLAAPDRGPFDGRTNVPYRDRVHFLHLTVDTNASVNNIRVTLLDTRFLKNEANENFLGSSSAFDDDRPLNTLRLDPKGWPSATTASSSCRTNTDHTSSASIGKGILPSGWPGVLICPMAGTCSSSSATTI